jgi:hypothetical protein
MAQRLAFLDKIRNNVFPDYSKESGISQVPDPSAGEGMVAGAMVGITGPVNNPQMPWVTLTDNLTGQNYCVAIYNDTINKYLGECRYDYH